MTENALVQVIANNSDKIAQLSTDLYAGDQESFETVLIGLLKAMATDIPIVGKAIGTGLDKLFARSAFVQMQGALAQRKTEEDSERLAQQLADNIAVFFEDTLIQLARINQTNHDKILTEFADLRHRLEFQQELAQQTPNFELNFDKINVTDGVGIDATGGSSKTLKAEEVNVSGGTGIKL